MLSDRDRQTLDEIERNFARSDQYLTFTVGTAPYEMTGRRGDILRRLALRIVDQRRVALTLSILAALMIAANRLVLAMLFASAEILMVCHHITGHSARSSLDEQH